ncbi:unnamed protein product [Lepidochelys olivacea]
MGGEASRERQGGRSWTSGLGRLAEKGRDGIAGHWGYVLDSQMSCDFHPTPPNPTLPGGPRSWFALVSCSPGPDTNPPSIPSIPSSKPFSSLGLDSLPPPDALQPDPCPALGLDPLPHLHPGTTTGPGTACHVYSPSRFPPVPWALASHWACGRLEPLAPVGLAAATSPWTLCFLCC